MEKYSTEMKLVAVWLVQEGGYSVSQVARMLGPHRRTISRWVAEPSRHVRSAEDLRQDGTPIPRNWDPVASRSSGEGPSGSRWKGVVERTPCDFGISSAALLAAVVSLLLSWWTTKLFALPALNRPGESGDSTS
jgi:hypothetical protein